MRKFLCAFTAVLILTAPLCVSCGAESETTGGVVSQDVTSSADKDKEDEKTSGESVEDEDENEETAAAETTTVAETTTAAETTAVPETETVTEAAPTDVDSSALSGHSFSIDNFVTQVYSNEELENAFDEIDSIISEYGTSISFAYYNIDTGAAVRYNESKSYGTCSTVKAPYCKYLLESGIDLDEEFGVSYYWSGDYGTVASMSYGTKLTAREYITYTICQSDNSAYYNLVKHYGYYGFNEMNRSLGVSYSLGNTWIFTHCTAEDLLKQYIDIYEFAEENERGRWLVELMQDTDVETQITAELAEEYPVAHKYGSDSSQTCFHDCAIVYANSPFVLVIMTNQVPETEESCKVFRRLARQFDNVNSLLVQTS